MTNSGISMAITGPAGSGKSTVGEALAKKFGKCVNIDADHIIHMIVSGFYKDSSNPGGWSYSEWELVGESIGLLANNFQGKGFNVVINGYIGEPGWSVLERQVSFRHKFLLLPELNTLKIRDEQRPGDQQMGQKVVAVHYNHFLNSDIYKDFIKIDSTNHSVEETVTTICDMSER